MGKQKGVPSTTGIHGTAPIQDWAVLGRSRRLLTVDKGVSAQGTALGTQGLFFLLFVWSACPGAQHSMYDTLG